MFYRRKPTVVRAIKFDSWNDEIAEFCGPSFMMEDEDGLHLFTLHGRAVAKRGDYLIKTDVAEVYPLRSEVFEELYEKAHA